MIETNFSLVITSQQIHLILKSLEQLSEALKIFDSMDEIIKKKLLVDFVIFSGVVNTDEGIDSYNSLLSKEPSDSIKVKMLGVEFQSTNFEYKVSFNKHTNYTNINIKSLLQCGVNDTIQNTNDSYKELSVQFPKLSMFI